MIIEAANQPVWPDADEIFDERGTIVLPDILANAGGVTVSYFEWVQNRQHYQWGLNRVRQELDRVLSDSFERVWDAGRRAQGQPAHRRLHPGHRPRRPGDDSGRHHMIDRRRFRRPCMQADSGLSQLQRERMPAVGRSRSAASLSPRATR